jgi:hypothetical protein
MPENDTPNEEQIPLIPRATLEDVVSVLKEIKEQLNLLVQEAVRYVERGS